VAVDVTLKADITVVCGSSGSGKSAWVKKQIKVKPRVIVWDVDEEYTNEKGFEAVTSKRDLLRLVKSRKKGRFAYVPKNLGEFDFWCKVAFAWGNCTAIAEETADVTTPAKAPEGWGVLVRRGRKRGISIIGVSQRPAESDKTIIGNASLIHCGMLKRPQDRKYMALEMDVDKSVLDSLKPLEWVEIKAGVQGHKKGKLRF